MLQTQPAGSSGDGRPAPALCFHHVAVQTNDLDNCASWYQDFFACQPSWSLSEFSELTRSRLSGIVRLTEMVMGDIRIHLFERPGRAAPHPNDSTIQFQHLCLHVQSGDELPIWRQRWLDLFSSGHYHFAFDDQPSEIVTDADGSQSFYAFDVNGLEFEFTHVPSQTP
jgi:hypothetical protein